MLPAYHLLEARRIAAERVRESDQVKLAREARRNPIERQDNEPNAVRRGAAQVALAAARMSLRLARALDACVADGVATSNRATPLG